jgi:hypothetical protein
VISRCDAVEDKFLLMAVALPASCAEFSVVPHLKYAYVVRERYIEVRAKIGAASSSQSSPSTKVNEKTKVTPRSALKENSGRRNSDAVG